MFLSILREHTAGDPMDDRGVAIFAKAFMGIPAQRIRIDCVSEANHNLIRLLDEPGNNCEA